MWVAANDIRVLWLCHTKTAKNLEKKLEVEKKPKFSHAWKKK